MFAKEGLNKRLTPITQEADVNLASVNYHFGSKKALIQAVVARYMDVFMPALDEELRGLDDESALTTLQVFEAFKLPLFSLNGIHKRGTERFLRLLGFAYSETQGHLRRYTQSAFGNVLQHLCRCYTEPTQSFLMKKCFSAYTLYLVRLCLRRYLGRH